MIKVPVELLNETVSRIIKVENTLAQNTSVLNSAWNGLKLEAASKKAVDPRISQARSMASRLSAEANRLSSYVSTCNSSFIEADRRETGSIKNINNTFKSISKSTNHSIGFYATNISFLKLSGVMGGLISIAGIGGVLLPWIKGLIDPAQQKVVTDKDEPSKVVDQQHSKEKKTELTDSDGNQLTQDDMIENWNNNLLDLIAKHESLGNYNAISGNANNQNIPITEMTIAEVQELQANFREHGMYSSAVGKYQVIRITLLETAEALNLPPDTIFNEETQDLIAMHLLRRRGYDDFISGNITEEEFANNLSKEWAALPLVNGDRAGESYYQGDGLNRALVEPGIILNLLRSYPRN